MSRFWVLKADGQTAVVVGELMMTGAGGPTFRVGDGAVVFNPRSVVVANGDIVYSPRTALADGYELDDETKAWLGNHEDWPPTKEQIMVRLANVALNGSYVFIQA